MSSQLKKGMDMKKDNNEQKENNIVDVEKALKEMRESWADICTAFGADPEIPVSPEVLRNSIHTVMIDLYGLEHMEYVKKSGKTLEKLHESYLKCLIKAAFIHVESEDLSIWKEEVLRYLKEMITDEVLSDTGIKVEDNEAVTLEELLLDIQRIFSISNQLNIIKGMESGAISQESFMNLEDNFIYMSIGIVQVCNGNAVIMGTAVSFIKALIKINDNILKSISQMLSR